MRMKDAYSAKAIAAVYGNAGSNTIAYLGAGLFPAKKKTGLDLKWIKSSKGVAVSLKPSAFDTVSTIRTREGAKIQETEMAFFKESMLIKEQDEQEIMRVEDSADPFAREVIERLYDDASTLIAGADVVPERMRMSLLANENGKPSISISADGATYAYDYDPNNAYKTNNFVELSGTSAWTDTEHSDPMANIETAQDLVEARTGSRPTRMIISKATMNLLKKNKTIKGYIVASNPAGSVMITDAKVKELISTELGIDVLVYTKLYKDESGNVKKFYPDGMATLLPDGDLGSTWYGMTPDERTGVMDKSKDVSIVNTGVAVAVKIEDDPVQTKTTVSEIVLPSFERMDETYMLKVGTVAY